MEGRKDIFWFPIKFNVMFRREDEELREKIEGDESYTINAFNKFLDLFTSQTK